MKYRADIDGLRSIAILLVLVFHFDLLSSGKAGFIGVDIFFVISGYLITGIIVKQLGAGRFSMGDFLFRRVHRLAPALIATLLIYLIAGYFLLLPDMFAELAFEALLSQLYVINFYFWQTVHYFGLQTTSVPLLHMWSLALEEQFYLLFPLFCMGIYAWRPDWLLRACIALALLSFALALMLEPQRPEAAFYLLPTRAWELLVGSILAIASAKRVPAVGWHAVYGILGMALIAAGILLYTPASAVPGWLITLPVGGTALLLLAGNDPNAPTTRLLSWKPLVWIGLVSYPAYLVHWPVLVLLTESVFEFTLPWKLFGFVLSFLLAWAVYALVEAPIRSYRVLQTKARFGIAAGISTIALIVGSAFISAHGGLPERFTPEVTDLLAFQNDEPLTFRECIGKLAPDAAPCRLGDPTATPRFLVIGDSHANAYAEAINKWLIRDGEAALFSFQHGCLPVWGMGPERCTSQVSRALDLIEADSNIDAVLLISIWRQAYERGVLADGKWVSGAHAAEAFDIKLQETVAAFADKNVRTVLIEPFFSTSKSTLRTMASNIAFQRDWPTHEDRSTYEATFARLFDTFSKAERLGAKRVSLIDDFCSANICSGLYEGRPIFTDTNHVASWLSDRLSEVFEAKLKDPKMELFEPVQ